MSASIVLKFQGFSPSEFTQSYVNSILQELYSEAPYKSVLRATFFRKKNDIIANVKISSSKGHYFATATAPRIKEVGKKIMHQMKRQIKKHEVLKLHHHDSLIEVPLKEDLENTEA